MEKLITTVNEYPWTSFFTFLALYILMAGIGVIVETIFKRKNG